MVPICGPTAIIYSFHLQFLNPAGSSFALHTAAQVQGHFPCTPQHVKYHLLIASQTWHKVSFQHASKLYIYTGYLGCHLAEVGLVWLPVWEVALTQIDDIAVGHFELPCSAHVASRLSCVHLVAWWSYLCLCFEWLPKDTMGTYALSMHLCIVMCILQQSTHASTKLSYHSSILSFEYMIRTHKHLSKHALILLE
jgi:hypothetical protein